MLWLAAHMWILLIAAFAIGLGVGWWIWGAHATNTSPVSSEDQPMGTLEIDFETMDDADDESREALTNDDVDSTSGRSGRSKT